MYQNGRRDFGSFTLPEGMKKNQKLDAPVFTPTTKSDEHDRPVTPKEIVEEGMLSAEMTEKVEAIAKALFVRGQEIAASRGLILVDTKYEFGTDEAGNLYLIDEIHTPDSSRYWKAGSYEERFGRGEEPEYFDKEFLRLWFRENCDPYNDPVLPPAPVELIVELTRRYIEIYETITGETFTYDFSVSPEERIKKNLGIA
jgi:phosphoribosylaminoimidazole-succinocarboxamide synthase